MSSLWVQLIILANTIFTIANTWISKSDSGVKRSTLINTAVNQALHQVTNMIMSGQLQKDAASGVYLDIVNQVANGITLTDSEKGAALSQLTSLLQARKAV